GQFSRGCGLSYEAVESPQDPRAQLNANSEQRPGTPVLSSGGEWMVLRSCIRENVRCVIFSSKKRTRKGRNLGEGQSAAETRDRKKTKAGGLLRHSIYSLKKVARLPSSSVETSSVASVNNDWKHWVVMHGNEQMAVEDVWGIEKAIEVKFNGDNVNMFSVLSRADKRQQAKSGGAPAGGGVDEKGVGGLEKRKEVRKLVGEKNPFIVCLQETKMHSCDDFLVSSLWGSSPYDFSFRPSVGASGGLLTIWDSTEVEVWSSVSREHVLWSHGRLVKSGEEFYLANVYSPCDSGAKQVLWDSLTERIQALDGKRVCVCGDFNAVRSVEERRSSRIGPLPMDHIPFNRFIVDNVLIDLPMSGQKYTWYKGDGTSMSRLDRFLLSEEWCLAWPNCV
ncbi:cytochrome P450, partial [Trifolium medium]|nr:cytochrome P450 [Trifolium medium]